MPRARTCLAIASLVAIACGRSPDRTPPASASPPPPPSFTIHEWGLFGLDIASPARVAAAAGTRPEPDAPSSVGRMLEGHFGERATGIRGLGLTGASGGKPVIYVHLDEGVDEARFAIALGIGAGSVAETFPVTAAEPTRLLFGPITARRGGCVAPSAPPIASSPACTSTPDGFCEAAEIGRYRGEGDVCLALGDSSSELLFYRAIDLDPARLPLVLAREGAGYAVRNPSGAAIDGPVIFIERSPASEVRYRVLATTERSGPVPAGGSLADAAAARALLLAHARSLGLGEAEADAFIDAWAPAFFDTCHRTGPEAVGQAPSALAPSNVSLLYFAPRSLVDAMLPMTVDPPARQVHRAFLVRVIDGASRLSAAGYEDASGLESLARAGQGVSYATGPMHDAITPHVGLERPAVRGDLTPDQVRRVLQRNIAQVAHCYEQGLVRDPALRGDVTIEIAIGTTGAVSTSRVVRSSTRDPALEACIAGAVRRWAFPTVDPAGTSIAEFEYHLAAPAR